MFFICLETRTSNSKQVWELLKSACSEDEQTAHALVTAAELTLPQNSLTTAIDLAGNYYRVPIACINDPQNYNVNKQLDAMKSKKSPKERELNVSSFFTIFSSNFDNPESPKTPSL